MRDERAMLGGMLKSMVALLLVVPAAVADPAQRRQFDNTPKCQFANHVAAAKGHLALRSLLLKIEGSAREAIIEGGKPIGAPMKSSEALKRARNEAAASGITLEEIAGFDLDDVLEAVEKFCGPVVSPVAPPKAAAPLAPVRNACAEAMDEFSAAFNAPDNKRAMAEKTVSQRARVAGARVNAACPN